MQCVFRKVAVMAVLMLAGLSSASGNEKPNIIVIVADDLGWNDVGYNGSEIRTPHIDRLASQGARLDRFYVQPTCSPTRASLLTGRSSIRLGVFNPLSTKNEKGLPLTERLLPELLQEQGYRTALVGKWHLGFRQRAYLPLSRGFDHFYGSVSGGVGHWDHVAAGAVDWQRNGETLREDGYSTHLLTDEAVRLIEETGNNDPLFLMLSYNAPHLPAEAPQETVSAYSAIENHQRRYHAAMVSEIDRGLGQLIDVLASRGMLENTLIWFLSDNGGLNASSFSPRLVAFVEQLDHWFDEHTVPVNFIEFVRSNVREGAADNTPLRKGKKSVYEGGVRVPAFVYWHGKVKPHVQGRMLTVEDVVPTLLSMLGREQDAEFDGVSQWSVLLQEENGKSRKRLRSFVVSSWDGEAVYRYPWKLLQTNKGDVELYQLEVDPREENNMAQLKPALRDEMLEDLQSYPRGKSVNLSVLQTILAGDKFGGEEVNPPLTTLIK